MYSNLRFLYLHILRSDYKKVTRIDSKYFVLQGIKATALSFSYWVSVTPKINFAYDKLLIVSEISVVYLSGFLCWCSESLSVNSARCKDLGYRRRH